MLEGQRFELGVDYEVPVKFLYRELILPKLKIGKEVELWEGRKVANGLVLKIFDS